MAVINSPVVESDKPAVKQPQDHLHKAAKEARAQEVQQRQWKTWVQNPSWTYTTGDWGTITTATTGTYTTQDIVWRGWTNSTTSSTLTMQDYVWNTWQTADNRPAGWFREPVAETPEERQAREDRAQAAREEASRRHLAEQKRMTGAQDRAMELLMMILTNEERVWHDLHDEIMVSAPSGRMYVIEKRSVHGNIKEVDAHGCVLGRVCVQPGMFDADTRLSLPLADGWVGQYLAIKHDEEHLRATGNWSGRAACKQPGVPILGQAQRAA